jgi:hypothetical protein
MNVRLQGDQLRFRISPDEMEQLLKGQPLVERTYLPGGQQLLYSAVADGDIASIRLTSLTGGFILHVPSPALQRLAESLPSRSGITAIQALENGHVLSLAFEVDVRPRRREPV